MNSSDISNEGAVASTEGAAAPEPAEGSAVATAADAHAAAVDVAPPSVESSAPAEPSASGASVVVTAKAAPEIASPKSDEKPSAKPASLSLIPFVATQRAQTPPPPQTASLWRAAFDKRFQIGVVAAGLAVIGTVATAAISYKDAQEQSVVAQYSETQNLAETVKSLKAKLSAMETAKHDEVADLRKTVADLKSGLAAAHESGAVLAQLNARADRFEKDQGVRRDEIADLRKAIAELKTTQAAAHEPNASLIQVTARLDRIEHEEDARLEKLGERIDHDAAAHNADVASRLDKLEKKAVAPMVAAVAPQPAVQAPAPTPPAPPVLPKTPTQLPPVATNVSKETTGSIPAPQTVIHGWQVREVRGNAALIEGPYGYRQIAAGDTLPGAGRVERIEKRATGWAVITDRGVINSAYAGPYRMGGYGAFNDAYGPPEGEF